MSKKNPGADAAPGKTDHIAVASIAGTSEDDVGALRARIAELTEQLGAARTEGEKQALAAAEAQGALMQHADVQEIATGKTVTVSRCVGYKRVGWKDNGQPILSPLWEEEEVPTYFYKIDIPPVGGEGLIPNGVPFYHGTVYEVDIHTLRSWKEMVYRLWAHDRNVFGQNENSYRRETAPVLSGRGV